MARIFQKYSVEPEKIEKPVPLDRTEETAISLEKTLRYNHNAIRMADLAVEPTAKPKAFKPFSNIDPLDQDMALAASMCYMMKGMRIMMQSFGGYGGL